MAKELTILGLGYGFDLWSFNLRVTACRDPAMHYISTDFGAYSSSRFPLRTRTDRRDWTPYPTPAAIQPTWIINISMWNVLRCRLIYSISFITFSLQINSQYNDTFGIGVASYGALGHVPLDLQQFNF